MFTGIVAGSYRVSHVIQDGTITRYSVEFPSNLLVSLQSGASVSVSGVCQSVVKIEKNQVWFDAVQETLIKTTLKNLKKNDFVNLERSLVLGGEVGGHFLSGHIVGTAEIIEMDLGGSNKWKIKPDKKWMKYIFEKGYIGIDGASLTVVDRKQNNFSLCLIPETLKLQVFHQKKKGDLVNLEIDSQSQIIVETVERVLKSKFWAQK